MLGRFAVDNPLDTLAPVVSVEEILALQEAVARVTVSDPMRAYIITLINATRQNEWTRLGASPRASIALMRAAQATALMRGSDFVRPDDVQAMAEPVLAHRLVLSPEARMRNMTAQRVLGNILGSVQVPVKAR